MLILNLTLLPTLYFFVLAIYSVFIFSRKTLPILLIQLFNKSATFCFFFKLGFILFFFLIASLCTEGISPITLWQFAYVYVLLLETYKSRHFDDIHGSFHKCNHFGSLSNKTGIVGRKLKSKFILKMSSQ